LHFSYLAKSYVKLANKTTKQPANEPDKPANEPSNEPDKPAIEPSNEPDKPANKQASTGDGDLLNNKETSIEKQFVALQKFDVHEFVSNWSHVAYQVSISFVFGGLLYYSPYIIEQLSSYVDDSLNSTKLFHYLFIFIQFIAFLVASFQESKTDLSKSHDHECAVILFSISLGIVSIVNFSLGILLSVLVVPLILLIGSLRNCNKTIKQFAAGIFLLVSPSAIMGFISSYTNQGFNGVEEILVEVYLQNQLHDVWLYRFITLIYFPLWYQLYSVAVGNAYSR